MWGCMCFCTPETGESETLPQPLHPCLPSKRMTRIPATHHCWTEAHPHVPSHPLLGQSHACCPAAVGAILLSFLKRQVTSSHSSALDHNFLLSPQKLYFLPGVLPGSFFHVGTVLPCSLTGWRKESTPSTSSPFILLWHRKSSSHLGSYNWRLPQPPACGSCPKFQFSDLQISQ